MKLIDEFKAFALKGNVVDLAIGVIIGGAFGKIISSLVNDVLMPILGLLLGKMNFADLKYVIAPAAGDVPEVAIRYGQFFQTVVDFVIVAACIFMAVKIFNRLLVKQQEAAPAAPAQPPRQEVLLEEIRDLLKQEGR